LWTFSVSWYHCPVADKTVLLDDGNGPEAGSSVTIPVAGDTFTLVGYSFVTADGTVPVACVAVFLASGVLHVLSGAVLVDG
jgi:hypothetical protein